MTISNAIRIFLFRPSVNWIQFLVLIYLGFNYSFLGCIGLYVFFCMVIDPIIRYLVGATDEDFAKIDEAAATATSKSKSDDQE